MNLARWLERAGLSHGDLPALGFGNNTLRNYRDTAGRAARLAAALRQKFGLQPGERVAIAAKTCPDYLELMFGIWHAGLAAVPANAKLHGRELGYILEHSGARVCFVSRGFDGEIAPHAPATLERLIVRSAAALTTRCSQSRPDRRRAAAGRRSGVAVLHVGHSLGGPRARCSPIACSRRRASLTSVKSIRWRPVMCCCCTPRR